MNSLKKIKMIDKKNDKIGNSVFALFIIICVYLLIMIISSFCTHLFIPLELKDYVDNFLGIVLGTVGLILYVYKLFKIWK